MAASILNPIHPFMSAQPGYPSFARFSERDAPSFAAVAAPFDGSSATVVVRGLAANVDEQTVRVMCIFSTELVSVELVGLQDDDATTRSAVLRLKSLDGAYEVKNTLHGKNGLTVDIMGAFGQTSGPSSSGASSATSPAAAATQAPRFDATAFSPLDKTSPPLGANYMRNGKPSYADAGYAYRNLFSPQSPIGNHLSDQPRISGKSLINDATDDDDTGDILKDPRAYAENGSFPSQRRATAPHLGLTARMNSLSLNTGSNGMPTAQQHGHSAMYQPGTAQSNTMSPTSLSGVMGNFQPHYSIYNGRTHAPPPANPADQNPPCNTLYVGNLPMDASEDELRRLFSPARGYKRMCFRTKPNGPMCFVEFEDVSAATRALHELYGVALSNSKKGGIRLSFSKNPLGVRNPPGSGTGPAGPVGGPNGMMGPATNGFAAAHPPPGLTMPPGLGASRSASSFAVSAMSNGHSTVNGTGSYQASNGTTPYQSSNGNGNTPQGSGSAPGFGRDLWGTNGYFSPNNAFTSPPPPTGSYGRGRF